MTLLRIKGWLLQRWHRLRKPYAVDMGEYGKRGWIDSLPGKLVNTSLTFAELNAARRAYGDLPSKENMTSQFDSLSKEEIDELAKQWRPSDDPDFRRSINRYLSMRTELA